VPCSTHVDVGSALKYPCANHASCVVLKNPGPGAGCSRPPVVDKFYVLAVDSRCPSGDHEFHVMMPQTCEVRLTWEEHLGRDAVGWWLRRQTSDKWRRASWTVILSSTVTFCDALVLPPKCRSAAGAHFLRPASLRKPHLHGRCGVLLPKVCGSAACVVAIGNRL